MENVSTFLLFWFNSRPESRTSLLIYSQQTTIIWFNWETWVSADVLHRHWEISLPWKWRKETKLQRIFSLTNKINDEFSFIYSSMFPRPKCLFSTGQSFIFFIMKIRIYSTILSKENFQLFLRTVGRHFLSVNSKREQRKFSLLRVNLFRIVS